jgi:hypothetical protein
MKHEGYKPSLMAELRKFAEAEEYVLEDGTSLFDYIPEA